MLINVGFECVSLKLEKKMECIDTTQMRTMFEKERVVVGWSTHFYAKSKKN